MTYCTFITFFTLNRELMCILPRISGRASHISGFQGRVRSSRLQCEGHNSGPALSPCFLAPPPAPPLTMGPMGRALCAKLLQSCLTLFDPMDRSPPGSSVHRILQARILELGCHALLQGIFLTQGSNSRLLCLLHWQAGSLALALPGNPKCLNSCESQS